ncbi:2-dehydro-3-deoxyphosphooctonate aldolase (KDO 8-P synthase) [Mucilaginibacter gracilis]|uniref:3-deoxy-8-phosphooctulonate synthase n=1 Tax=Mucilaginibacter gracilis TaxID=423350 RepID=A0A495J0J5_9SPHI|nr:3-deoxy-8-phosphooctulonate synthase [Mucilaginibacter gracilis]RKR82505.1 2-dehydro-3-deoxyphosphooctonate aldolase (KDO 8-P synthase) [Mucilaginibacter gracilis]
MLFNNIKTNTFFVLGPCVIENQDLLYTVAEVVATLGQKFNVPVVFKSSFDKANRTSIHSYRGPGIEKGLEMLLKVKEHFGLPLTTDIHEPYQAAIAGQVVDILQIPAFLCRQTDLLVAAAQTGKIVNVKKAQFLSGQDMFYPAQKVIEAGNNQVILTERGNMYGYNNLAVDFRNVYDMKQFGHPVCMDCTHSVQRPGGAGGKTGGDRNFVPMMALAAKAFGADGYFIETHPDPDNALSDGPNMVKLHQLEAVIEPLIR